MSNSRCTYPGVCKRETLPAVKAEERHGAESVASATQHHSSVKLFHLKIMSSEESEKLNLLRIFMRESYH